MDTFPPVLLQLLLRLTVSDSSDMYSNYLSLLSVSRSVNFSILYIYMSSLHVEFARRTRALSQN